MDAATLIIGVGLVALLVAIVAIVNSVVAQLVDDREWTFNKELTSFAAIVFVGLPLAGAAWAAVAHIPSTGVRAAVVGLAVVCVVLLNLWHRHRRGRPAPQEIDTVQ